MIFEILRGKICSPDNEVRVSRTMSVAHYPGRLRGLVLQAGPNGLLEQVAGLDLGRRAPKRFGTNRFTFNSVKWTRLNFGQLDSVDWVYNLTGLTHFFVGYQLGNGAG